MAPPTGALGRPQPTLLLLLLPSHDLLEAGVQENEKKKGRERKIDAFSFVSHPFLGPQDRIRGHFLELSL